MQRALYGREQNQFVEFESKPSRHGDLSERTNGSSTLRKGMKNVKNMRQIFQIEDQIKGTVKCG
jgi:hypothetical protein